MWYSKKSTDLSTKLIGYLEKCTSFYLTHNNSEKFDNNLETFTKKKLKEFSRNEIDSFVDEWKNRSTVIYNSLNSIGQIANKTFNLSKLPSRVTYLTEDCSLMSIDTELLSDQIELDKIGSKSVTSTSESVKMSPMLDGQTNDRLVKF